MRGCRVRGSLEELETPVATYILAATRDRSCRIVTGIAAEADSPIYIEVGGLKVSLERNGLLGQAVS